MLSYLDLSEKSLALVRSILLSVALCDLSGLVHAQEPVVTSIDVGR